MRRLLNTLYITSEESYLALDGENVIIKKGEEIAARFPLHTLEAIITFAYAGASPALMGASRKSSRGEQRQRSSSQAAVPYC